MSTGTNAKRIKIYKRMARPVTPSKNAVGGGVHGKAQTSPNAAKPSVAKSGEAETSPTADHEGGWGDPPGADRLHHEVLNEYMWLDLTLGPGKNWDDGADIIKVCELYIFRLYIMLYGASSDYCATIIFIYASSDFACRSFLCWCTYLRTFTWFIAHLQKYCAF